MTERRVDGPHRLGAAPQLATVAMMAVSDEGAAVSARAPHSRPPRLPGGPQGRGASRTGAMQKVCLAVLVGRAGPLDFKAGDGSADERAGAAGLAQGGGTARRAPGDVAAIIGAADIVDFAP